MPGAQNATPEALGIRARLRAASAVALMALAALACQEPVDSRPVVGVSVPPQAYVVDRLAGEHVAVEVMIPPGANPTTYEPSLRQLRRLHSAALYLKVGHPSFPFEAAWLDEILEQAPGLRVVDGSAGLPVRDGDPHVWVAPRHLEQLAIRTEAALEEILPLQQESLRANLEALRGEIDALDAEIRGLLANARERRFLVFHPAWGYFAEAYDLEPWAIEHEHKEPDPHELALLIEQARAAGVRVVFVQPQFDPRSAELVADEIGARVETLDPMARDWPDNLRRVARALAEALPE